MATSRERSTSTLPDYFSAWLLHAYRRPLVFLIGLFVVPLLIILFVTYRVHLSLFRAQSQQHLSVASRLGAEIVEETLKESFRFGGMLAGQAGLADQVRRLDRDTLTQRLQEALLHHPRVDAAVIADLKGQVIAAYPASTGASLAGEAPFESARRAEWAPSVSGVFLREGPQLEKVVVLTLPIHNIGDAVIGVLQLQHRVEEVRSWLQKVRVEPNGFLYVVDHQDQLVVYPYQILPGKPKVVSEWPTVSRTLLPEGDRFVFNDPKTQAPWLAAVHPVGELGWRVVAVQPERAALAPLYRVLLILSLLVLLLVAMVIGMSLRWIQLHAFSLRLLRQNAKMLKSTQQKRWMEKDES